MFHAFFDFLRDLGPPFGMVVAIVAIACAAGVVNTISKQVRVFADHEADRRLKRDLLEAGYQTDDVEQIANLEVTAEYKKPKMSA
ncbi:hypothetical protein [Botrimarina sp.]|uniref:hypothetical protein n=1 Tax=Botrimarina sp. TaxID=2795802 RepID=UPI0032EF26B0